MEFAYYQAVICVVKVYFIFLIIFFFLNKIYRNIENSSLVPTNILIYKDGDFQIPYLPQYNLIQVANIN